KWPGITLALIGPPLIPPALIPEPVTLPRPVPAIRRHTHNRSARPYWPAVSTAPSAITIRTPVKPATRSTAQIGARTAMRQTPIRHRRALRNVVGLMKENSLGQPVQAPAQPSPAHMAERIHRDPQPKLNSRRPNRGVKQRSQSPQQRKSLRKSLIRCNQIPVHTPRVVV